MYPNFPLFNGLHLSDPAPAGQATRCWDAIAAHPLGVGSAPAGAFCLPQLTPHPLVV